MEEYRLFNYLKDSGWELVDGRTWGPATGWEIANNEAFITIEPLNLTKPNFASSFTPYPYINVAGIFNGAYDLSGIAQTGSTVLVRYWGTITKHPEITWLSAFDIAVEVEDFVDQGDRWYFETSYEDSYEYAVDDPSNFRLSTFFSANGAYGGTAYIQNFEAEVFVDIQVLPPPPYEPPLYEGYLWWDAEGWSPFYLPEEDCASSPKVLDIIPVSGKHYIWRENNHATLEFNGECADDGFYYSFDPDLIIDVPASEIEVYLYGDYGDSIEWAVRFLPAGLESGYDLWVLDMVADVVTESKTYRTNIRLFPGGE